MHISYSDGCCFIKLINNVRATCMIRTDTHLQNTCRMCNNQDETQQHILIERKVIESEDSNR